MPEEDKNLLKDLYLLRSYSGFEDPIRLYITRFLTNLGIPFINYNGNILGLNHPGAPLFSAHLDMVNTEGYKLTGNEYALDNNHVFTLDSKACIRLYRDKDKKHQTSLGADDKNGIWAILTLLRNNRDINFAFCHSEEIGGTGSEQVISDKDLATFIEGCKFGIIIDRRNGSDIIGYSNKYCMALDDKLEKFAKEFGYEFKCTTGSVSDADRFSKLIECVNLSCGYYNPHSSTEYTNLNELWNTYLFCNDILDSFPYESVSPDRMRSFKSTTAPYRTYVSTTSTYYGNGSTYYGRSGNTTRYFGRKDEEESKDTDVKGSAVVTSQKKTSEKKRKEATITTSTITDGINSLELINMFEEASSSGAYWEMALKGFVVPLYDLETIKKEELAEDILISVKCSTCLENLFLVQGSVDEMFNQYYDIDGRFGTDKVYGICSQCYEILDISDQIRHIV